MKGLLISIYTILSNRLSLLPRSFYTMYMSACTKHSTSAKAKKENHQVGDSQTMLCVCVKHMLETSSHIHCDVTRGVSKCRGIMDLIHFLLCAFAGMCKFAEPSSLEIVNVRLSSAASSSSICSAELIVRLQVNWHPPCNAPSPRFKHSQHRKQTTMFIKEVDRRHARNSRSRPMMRFFSHRQTHSSEMWYCKGI